WSVEKQIGGYSGRNRDFEELLALPAESFDLDLGNIAGNQVGELARQCHTLWSTGGDDVSGFELHVLGEAEDDLLDGEDHVRRRRPLARFTVDPAEQTEIMGVDGISGDEDRTQRHGVLHTFAL